MHMWRHLLHGHTASPIIPPADSPFQNQVSPRCLKSARGFFAALRMTLPGHSWLCPGHVILSAAKNPAPLVLTAKNAGEKVQIILYT